MILDFHTHLGDIWPTYCGIALRETAPPPHYLMISSDDIVDELRVFYRKRPPMWSPGFFKHALITVWRRARTIRGMVIPNLLKDIRRHQIERSVVLPIEYADGIERSKHLIEACQGVPELIPFCSVHPDDPQHIEKMQTSMQMGARGLKLHPNFQRIRPDDAALFPLYEAYTAYHLPLILHSGLTGREGRFRSGRSFSSIERLEAIPRNFPRLSVVLAHAGITQYEQAITLAQRYQNVYLELSGQPASHIRRALAAIGAERLLFGSDWPFWPQVFALEAIKQATAGDDAARRRILSTNAEELLRLQETVMPS